jgi:hypothetical protein
MPAEKWDSQHPDLKEPFTYDQMWFSAILIELENCSGGIRELAKILRQDPPAKEGPKT